jgi:uncharacterized SAM-binding protein YcdF (DUF218 family)
MMSRRILKFILYTAGTLFLIFFVFCFTPCPFYAWYKMSMKYAGVHRPPQIIVVLGGGGMPSESGLMRCWYGAKAANFYTHTRVIIALPGDTVDSTSSIKQMKEEMILRGVSASRITFEPQGANTRAQALNIRNLLGRMTSPPGVLPESIKRGLGYNILIVTSPEHLYRAFLTFRKAGFIRIDGLPSFETAIESDITFDDMLIGGKRWMPRIGNNITLRYQFWTQMHYEELILREGFAIVYYKLSGWI